ncbi:MAG TPA: hypothetical protein VG797_00865 [Phycisphaerales bacterium]|nr:hypothetical protein [Phycisphaerales bacterium]
MSSPSHKSIARCLGEFVGHILQGARTKVDNPPSGAPHRVEVEERRVHSADGDVVLRRTIIEEVTLTPREGRG